MTDESGVSTGTLDKPSDAGTGPGGVVKRWLMELDLADKEEKFWRLQAKDASDRYRDEKMQGQTPTRYAGETRFNILYSNVQTIVPALWNNPPKPDVRRRFRDQDPSGKLVSTLMERGLSFSMDAGAFDEKVKMDVRDGQIVGRGISRVRYKPVTAEQTDPMTGETYEAIVSEEVGIEHVQWDEFRHGPAKVWDDVPWIAFRHRLRRTEAEAMLGQKLPSDIELDHSPDGLGEDDENEQLNDTFKRLTVWEIWDKEARKVIWLAPAYKERPLRTDDDPLTLEGFYPVPRPLYATEDTSSLTPIEPYRYYRDQAEELDTITRRITKIVQVMKWRGVYAATMEEMERLRDAVDGELVPSESIVTLLGSGGIDKAIWMMPIEQAAAALVSLYQQREQIKQVIFEITGLADVMRGSTDAQETLGAQQLKAQFGTMRLDDMRREVQRYARDLVRLMAEVIAEHFQPETLSLMTGIPVTPEMLQIMQADGPRGFRIDIETDATVAGNVAEEQRAMVEMLGGISQYVTAMGPAVMSGLFPMEAAKALLLSATRRFKMGREVEDALDQLGGQTGPDGQPIEGQPNPAQQAQDAQAQAAQQAEAQAQQQAQAEAERRQMEAQQKQAEMQARAESEARKMEMDEQRSQREHALRYQEHTDKMALEREKLAASKADRNARMKDGEVVDNDPLDSLGDAIQAMAEALQGVAQGQQAMVDGLKEAMQVITEQQTAPREVVRDASGQVVGVRIKGGPEMKLVRENGRPVGVEAV